MKKSLFTLLLLLGVVGNMFAQKEFLRVEMNQASVAGGSSSSIKVYGDLPSGIKSSYSYSKTTLIEILDTLSSLGYTLENVSTIAHSWDPAYFNEYEIYLLSKSTSSVPTNAKDVTVDHNSDADVYETGRYNLQGMPVDSAEKGIQIVVYSNHTTKTVVVE